jgi:hypothetical protein
MNGLPVTSGSWIPCLGQRYVHHCLDRPLLTKGESRIPLKDSSELFGRPSVLL